MLLKLSIITSQTLKKIETGDFNIFGKNTVSLPMDESAEIYELTLQASVFSICPVRALNDAAEPKSYEYDWIIRITDNEGHRVYLTTNEYVKITIM